MQYLWKYVRKTQFIYINIYNQLINMCIFNEACPPTILEEPPPTTVYSCQISTKSAKYMQRYAKKTILNPTWKLVFMHILMRSSNQIQLAQLQTPRYTHAKFEVDPLRYCAHKAIIVAGDLLVWVVCILAPTHGG